MNRNEYQTIGKNFLSRWSEAAGQERASILHAAIGSQVSNPAAWYLLGFDRLRRGMIGDAARAFGMAHHQNVNLESAALLTFACLKARPDAPLDVLDQIAVTWREMRRPQLVESSHDREFIELLSRVDGDVPSHLTDLGRIAWLAAGPVGRDRLRAHQSAPDTWHDFFSSIPIGARDRPM